MDRFLYSKYKSTLSNILIKVWSYLVDHEHEKEIRKRLMEELEEMSGTCSSGFASRLVNVISGFGKFNIRISWEDQIIANFSGRLNAFARKITDKDSIFYTEKTEDILKLWFNYPEQKELKDKIINELQQVNTNDIISHYFSENKEEKISHCISWFSEQVLNELTVPSSFSINRMNFFIIF